MKRLILIVTLLTFGVNVAANDVVRLEQGNPAPFSGYLFSDQVEKQTRYRLIEADYTDKRNQQLQTIISNYEQQISIYDKRLELYKNTSEELAKQVVSNKDVSFWEKSLYFILGATLTGIVSYGVVNTLK